MLSIQLLPTELIEQIAAGEMILRPSMAVKELLENSIDAQCKSVEVRVEKGGLRAIEVIDDGRGIPESELALAITRHATSKLSALKDLMHLNTYGFRGEALASLAAISELQIISRTADADCAYRLIQNSDKQWETLPDGHPVGTSVKANHLFYNTPARKKFMASEQTEWVQVDRVVKQAALSYPNVHFTVKHNGKRLRSYPVLDRQDFDAQTTRIRQVLGKAFLDTSIHFMGRGERGLRVIGWVAPATSSSQILFVNRRCIRDKILMHAVKASFLKAASAHPWLQSRMLSTETLSILLFLDISPSEIDVNVHPAKEEVSFQHPRQVHDLIWHAVQVAIREQALSRAVTQEAGHAHMEHESVSDLSRLNPCPTSVVTASTLLPSDSNRLSVEGVNKETTGQTVDYAQQWKSFSALESDNGSGTSSLRSFLAPAAMGRISDAHGCHESLGRLGHSVLALDPKALACCLGRFITLYQDKYLVLLNEAALRFYEFQAFRLAYQTGCMERGVAPSFKFSEPLLIDWSPLLLRDATAEQRSQIIDAGSKCWFPRGFQWEQMGNLTLLRAVPSLWMHLDWRDMWPKFLETFGAQFVTTDPVDWEVLLATFLPHEDATPVTCVKMLSDLECQPWPASTRERFDQLRKSVPLEDLIGRCFLSNKDAFGVGKPDVV